MEDSCWLAAEPVAVSCWCCEGVTAANPETHAAVGADLRRLMQPSPDCGAPHLLPSPPPQPSPPLQQPSRLPAAPGNMLLVPALALPPARAAYAPGSREVIVHVAATPPNTRYTHRALREKAMHEGLHGGTEGEGGMGWRERGGGLVGESHLLGADLLPSLMALSPRRQTLRPHPLGGVLLGIAAWSLQHQAAGRGQAGQASSREATTTGAPTTAPRPTWQQRCLLGSGSPCGRSTWDVTRASTGKLR